jgi:hypothetical protein
MRSTSNILVTIYFFISICVAASQSCTAVTYTFSPEKHSVYLDQRDPDSNWVSKSGLLVVSALNENCRSVLRFDLEGWVPPTDSILQAKLYLYHYRGDNYTGVRTINVYILTTAFHESTATWNAPWATPGGDYDNTLSSSADVPETWENWVFWDVTDIMKNRWDNLVNYGFLIKDPVEDTPSDGPYIRFYSRRCLNDADTLNNFPAYLEVITSTSSDVKINEENVSRGFSLMQNYPNPFNGETALQFDLPRTSNVSMVIYNLLGERVKTLIDGSRPAGTNAVVWDGTDQRGKPVSSGMYFYRLSTENYTRTKRLFYLK